MSATPSYIDEVKDKWAAATARSRSLNAPPASAPPPPQPKPANRHEQTDLLARQLLRNTITARTILPHVNATLLRRMLHAALDQIEGKVTRKEAQ